jgi:hypothetical protein
MLLTCRLIPVTASLVGLVSNPLGIGHVMWIVMDSNHQESSSAAGLQPGAFAISANNPKLKRMFYTDNRFPCF